MNWKKIFKNNTHSANKFKEFLEKNYKEPVSFNLSTISFLTINVGNNSTFFNDRDLYDFFDWCGVIGSIKYSDNGFVYKIKIINNDKFISDNKKCNIVYESRFRAEAEMFEEMFNILNNKLMDKQ